MADQVKRYLFFGAHPDDAEEVMGGTAVTHGVCHPVSLETTTWAV